MAYDRSNTGILNINYQKAKDLNEAIDKKLEEEVIAKIRKRPDYKGDCTIDVSGTLREFAALLLRPDTTDQQVEDAIKKMGVISFWTAGWKRRSIKDDSVFLSVTYKEKDSDQPTNTDYRADSQKNNEQPEVNNQTVIDLGTNDGNPFESPSEEEIEKYKTEKQNQ